MAEKKQIIFRADGNAQIGLGHVMRCLALAKMLNGQFSMRFAIVDPSPDVSTLLDNASLTVVTLPAVPNDHSFLSTIQPDEIVVLDGYSFSESFQRQIRAHAKKLVFIDDLLAGHQVADVVVNHAGGVVVDEYDAEAHTQFYLGPHYALLRPEFLQPEGFGPPPANGPIFISLGGADPNNISLTVLEAIRQVDPTLAVRLVLGPFHPNRASIDAFRNQLPNLTVLQNLSAGQMVAELTQCSLAITACSTIAYEVCAVNRPLIAVVTADNQDRLARFLTDEKLALSVNFPTLLTRLTPVVALGKMLTLAIQSFQFSPDSVADTLANQRRFFDGRSPDRFRALFDKLSGADDSSSSDRPEYDVHSAVADSDRPVGATRVANVTLTHRFARPADSPLYFNWANDPDTRRQSFSSAPISPDTHTVWFTRKLADANALLLVFENETGDAVGQVRFERTPVADRPGEVIIGLSVDAKHRGKGLASQLIEQGCAVCRAQWGNVLIHAHIKPDNPASVRAFGRAGFKLSGESGKFAPQNHEVPRLIFTYPA